MANNRIAFGLCKRYGIELPKNATPKDTWDALDKIPANEFKKLLLARQEAILKDWKAKTAKERKGLSAKISGDGIPEHDEPVLLQTIDFNDNKAVKNILTEFEKSAIMEPVETACVITKSGQVYKCFGAKDRVFPDFDLKDELIGAKVSHNHPITETTYSFSGNDLQLFQEYRLTLLRGCDEKYTYAFTQNAEDVDEYLDYDIAMITVESYQHLKNIQTAQQYGIGYRRWKNE